MALKYQRNPLGRREPERLHPIPGLLDVWGQASSSWNNGEAEKVPVLGPPGSSPQDLSWPGRQSSPGTAVVCSVALSPSTRRPPDGMLIPSPVLLTQSSLAMALTAVCSTELTLRFRGLPSVSI